MRIVGALIATFGLWFAMATFMTQVPVIAKCSALIRWALSWSVSWAIVGFAIMAMGWLHLFYAAVFFAAGLVAGTLATVKLMSTIARPSPSRWRQSIGALSYPDFVVASVGLIAVATAVVGAIRQPIGGEEQSYKWVTPLVWAHAHHFIEVKHRLSNGFNLAEYLTVPAATFHALVVARFVEVAVLVGIGLSAAALANKAGVRRGWWIGVAAVSIPLAVIDANFVGSDLEPAAFLVSAALAFLALGGRCRIAAYVLLTAAAVQAKVIVAPVAIVMTIVLVLLFDGLRGRQALRRIVGYSTGAVGSLVVGFMHTLVLTGHFVMNDVRSIYPSGSHALADGAAAGRIPNLFDILLLPINPFITGIVGQREPYGGRTGLVMLVGLPLVLILIFKTWDLKTRMVEFFILGASTYLIIAPVFIKTRFLLVSWIFFLVAIGIAGEELAGRNDRLRRVGLWAVPGILFLSVLDPVHVIARLV